MTVMTSPNLPTIAAMPTGAPPLPSTSTEPEGNLAWIRKITVEEYHRMIQHGVLQEGEPVELLEGYLVKKMLRTPQHDYAITVLNAAILALLTRAYVLRPQLALTMNDSEPEPDLAVARGPITKYRTRHPIPEDCVLIIEVSSSSLLRDRNEKARIYARANVACYWIVNIEEGVVEVYSRPTASASLPRFEGREVFKLGDAIPLVLDGSELGRIAVADILPPAE